jgi:hypothetical protein
MAATFYVDAHAPNDDGDGSASHPRKTIEGGAALMSSDGGDTLVLRPGTYSAMRDAVRELTPGTVNAWNVIKAETDGTVTITAPLNMPRADHFLQFEGLRWDYPDIKFVTGRYVKFLRCGFKDGAPSGNTVVLAIGTNDATPGAQYVLVEDAYVYGSGGRYKVLVYNADKVVLRRVVGRQQGGWSDTKGDPQGVVALYNSTNVLTQNLLLLDSGGTGYFEAALYHPSNQRASRNIRNYGAIIMNIAGTGVGWDDHVVSTGNLLEDSIIWKTGAAISINGARHEGVLDHLTIGKAAAGVNDWRDGGGFTLKNSLLWGVNGKNLRAVEHSHNVCHAPSCQGETSMNPASSGLQWLPRVEPSSALGHAGESSTPIGATVLSRLGASGTLYGEPGYDRPTVQALWPWPGEALIHKAMCEDVGVTTGLCERPSITQYVWEQLGRPMPASLASHR